MTAKLVLFQQRDYLVSDRIVKEIKKPALPTRVATVFPLTADGINLALQHVRKDCHAWLINLDLSDNIRPSVLLATAIAAKRNGNCRQVR